MGKTNKLLWIILVLALGIIGYCFRWTFLYKFDPVYWEHFYYTSQWNIPNSTNVIPDEGVYRYIGYRLVNGENPFNVDYWVPPLGKYFYGLSAKYLSNPYWTSWGWYLILLGLSYGLTKNIWVLLLVATNPLIVSQIGQTMLDLPQGVFLLAQVACLFANNFILAGMMLGLMMGIKIGFFGPVVGIVGIFYIWQKTKSIKATLKYLVAIPIGYMMAYFCYFAVHPNPIPWFRLHQKIFDYWKNSGTASHPLNILSYIFMNQFNQVKGEGRMWMKTAEWSVVFPVSVLLIVRSWWSKINLNDRYLSLLIGGWIGCSMLIDFWPRYLVPLATLLTIFMVSFWKNKKWWLAIILILNFVCLIPVLKTKQKIISGGNEKTVTIVNPVRSRVLWKDHSLKPIEDQYKIINKYNLKATWLLQNEVLKDKEVVNTLKSFDKNQELGVFLEVSKNLAQEARIYFDESRPWYDPGVVFLSGYEPSERKIIIDKIISNFKNTFGYTPKSAGAWWVDSVSQQYLEKKYQIKTVMIVADQKTTDKYGVWGQWWGYPYLAATDNILVPGESETVIIQWAMRDLEQAYFGNGPKISNYSLQANDYVSQGLNIKYFENLAKKYLNVNKLGQITVGLETGMESVGMEKEFERQIKWIDDNKVKSLTMSEFGDKYRQVYGNENPEKVVIGDWVLTPYYRQNLKLKERTDYVNGLVFADYYAKDRAPFLNRVYTKDNLRNKQWLTKEMMINIGVMLAGFLLVYKFKKWGILLLVLIWLCIRARYTVVNGEVMIGILIDNFRFVGINLKHGLINTDLSNIVAQSMLKLKL